MLPFRPSRFSVSNGMTFRCQTPSQNHQHDSTLRSGALIQPVGKAVGKLLVKKEIYRLKVPPRQHSFQHAPGMLGQLCRQGREKWKGEVAKRTISKPWLLIKFDKRDLFGFLNILQGSWKFMQDGVVLMFNSNHILPVPLQSTRNTQWLEDTPEGYLASPTTAWHATLLSLNTLLWLPTDPIQQLFHPPATSEHTWSYRTHHSSLSRLATCSPKHIWLCRTDLLEVPGPLLAVDALDPSNKLHLVFKTLP